MVDKHLPDTDTVVRYVKKEYIPQSVRGGAFYLRKTEKGIEDGISVYWLQCFKVNTKAEQLVKARRAIKRSNFTMKPNGCLVELCVRETKERVNRAFDKHKCKIEFVSTCINHPDEYRRSHSEIRGVPCPDSPEAEMVADLIAESEIDVYDAVLKQDC